MPSAGDASVKCPGCGADSSVIETRGTAYGTRRRRRCNALRPCPTFTTAEFVVPASLVPGVKTSGFAIVRQEDLEVLVDAVKKLMKNEA